MIDKTSPAPSTFDPSRLAPMGRQSLDVFDVVARTATSLVENIRGPVPDVFTHTNTLTQEKAAAALGRIKDENQENYLRLRYEPVVARVLVLDDDAKEHVLFISRFTPVPTSACGARLVSYRAPLGRLAALRVGDDASIVTPSGTRNYEIIERAAFRPIQDKGEWDSHDTRVEAQGYGAITVQSLRALLVGADGAEAEDILSAQLADDAAARNVIEGFRRELLRSISLRENPILDRFQDEVFRLPLASRLVLMGPPGSGKTTTLIKRLGQKLDWDGLDEDERERVEAGLAGKQYHTTSWLMFSPTDLLKAYVKEAFNQEGVPAPDERIQTWSDYRMQLGRGGLGILRSPGGPGIFVVRYNSALLQPGAVEQPIPWFEAFDGWQRRRFWTDLLEQANHLAACDDENARRVGQRLERLLAHSSTGALPPIGVLLNLGGGLSEQVEAIESQAQSLARRAANLAVNRDHAFLDDLGHFLARLNERPEPESDDTEDDEDDEEVEAAAPRVGRDAALAAYIRLVKQAARAEAAGRRPRAGSRTARLLDWLGDRIPSRNNLETLGRALQAQRALRRFVNPIRRYLRDIPRRYQRFRREAEGTEAWYGSDRFRQIDLAPLELDLIVLAMLRTVGELLAEQGIAALLGEPRFEFLRDLRELWRSQIVVDEATDFSPIQLACMAALCDPALNSFLACGDFNQRTTRWGSRSKDAVSWVFRDIVIREIAITYRHSRLLNEFARQVARLSEEDVPTAGLPDYVENEGVAPVCGLGLRDPEVCAGWLAQRIDEIENLSRPLPTVAVLVATEADVKPLTDALNQVLEDRNLRAVACSEGKFVGQDNDVRVFDVRHIKGLEFEAVFFVGLDRLAEQEPDLFNKYLYVGATRAATYLGITVHGPSLPTRVKSLESYFQTQWA